MLNRACTLRQPINRFIASADERFGDITTLLQEGRVVKRIPWSAFKLYNTDWARVEDTMAILIVRHLSMLIVDGSVIATMSRPRTRSSNHFWRSDSQHCGMLFP